MAAEATQFCLIVYGREAKTNDGYVVTKEGDAFWVETDEPDHWVEASSSRCNDRSAVPGHIKTFQTREAAQEFAKRWKGHPWYCDPSGDFDVIEIVPQYVQVFSGWGVVAARAVRG